MLIIDSENADFAPQSIEKRIDYLSNVTFLDSPENVKSTHMAHIDLIDTEIVLVGEDLVDELRCFIVGKARQRLERLKVERHKLTHPNS
ncbi:hypothetical protein GCM10027347_17340 [Larkinella harenae]